MDRLECKFSSEGLDSKTGVFSGYASVFGNTDTHGDVVEPGAFAVSLAEWKARGAFPTMKLMYGTSANPFASDLPLGKWTAMEEDDRGLRVEGKLSGMNTDRGRYNFSLVEDGALNGLSIGYTAEKFAAGNGVGIKRRLQTVRLKEVSLVPEGSNSAALIDEIKAWADGDRPTLPEFERFLREVGKFSKTEAKAIAGHGLSHLLRREAGRSTEEADFWSALGANPPT